MNGSKNQRFTTDDLGFISLQDYAACRGGNSFILGTSWKGAKVKLRRRKSSGGDWDLAKKHLIKARVYVVDYARIYGSFTLLFLEEVDIGFNSVMFKEVRSKIPRGKES